MAIRLEDHLDHLAAIARAEFRKHCLEPSHLSYDISAIIATAVVAAFNAVRTTAQRPVPIKRGTARGLGLRPPPQMHETWQRHPGPGWGVTDCPAAWTEPSGTTPIRPCGACGQPTIGRNPRNWPRCGTCLREEQAGKVWDGARWTILGQEGHQP